MTVQPLQRPTARALARAEAPPCAPSAQLTAVGGVMAGILILLGLIGVKHQQSITPRFAEMARNADLYHHYLPPITKISIVPFAVLAWAAVASLWVVYLGMLWRMRKSHVDARVVVGGAIVLVLVAQIVPPLFTTDLFSYAMFGRLAGVYDLNPYVATAAGGAPADPLMPYLYWRDISSPYGPLWTLISWWTAHGAHATPIELVMRFKLVALTAVLLDGWLIYRLVHRQHPEQAGWAYLAFAWNPLVLVEGVVLGHNDVVILAFLLSGAFLLRTRPFLGALGLTASALIKYSTLPLLGVAAARFVWPNLVRHRLLRVLQIGLAALALAVGCYLPFWAGPRILMSTVGEPGRGINNPLIGMFRWLLRQLTPGLIGAHSALGPVVLGATLFCLWQLFDLWKSRDRQQPLTGHYDLAAWCRTLTMFLVLWPRIHTWYFLPPLGLALAAGPQQRRLFWQVLTVTLVSYVSYFH